MSAPSTSPVFEVRGVTKAYHQGEVEVHALRANNGQQQALKIFSTGLPNSLETEEGRNHILYSLFWGSDEMDIAVIRIAGTTNKLWKTYWGGEQARLRMCYTGSWPE